MYLRGREPGGGQGGLSDIGYPLIEGNLECNEARWAKHTIFVARIPRFALKSAQFTLSEGKKRKTLLGHCTVNIMRPDPLDEGLHGSQDYTAEWFPSSYPLPAYMQNLSKCLRNT